MSIESTVDRHRDLTIFTLKGKVSVEEARERIISFYQQNPTRFVLWDTREAAIDHITDYNVRHLVETATKLLVRKEEGRTAIIASTVENIRVSSLAEIFSNVFRQSNPIKVFETVEEAHAWLEANDE